MGTIFYCRKLMLIVSVCLVEVPWEDLCYLVGEIMYGGHITDGWDRRLCRTYIQELLNPKMVKLNILIIMQTTILKLYCLWCNCCTKDLFKIDKFPQQNLKTFFFANLLDTFCFWKCFLLIFFLFNWNLEQVL